MVHRVHKAAVSSTNKHILQRDLTARDNLMQGLRFLAEQLLHSNLALDVSLFNDVYFEREEDPVALDLTEEDVDSNKGNIKIILLCNTLNIIYSDNTICLLACSFITKAHLWRHQLSGY